ncbi:hypothetical protein NPIL_493971 [Nephila pilipes]|uniref:Uncharacterized protein n=1 Tax=Nephila pilipes TaxID=299642 RepID=A0A8X6U8R1_NEPPI|nr:hypothetical protein NPIL_493971 [Nephila pilipes]
MTNEPRRRGPGSRDPRVWQHHMRQEIEKLLDREKIGRSEKGRLRIGVRVVPRLRRWTKWRLPTRPASFSCHEEDLFLIVLDEDIDPIIRRAETSLNKTGRTALHGMQNK